MIVIPVWQRLFSWLELLLAQFGPKFNPVAKGFAKLSFVKLLKVLNAFQGVFIKLITNVHGALI